VGLEVDVPGAPTGIVFNTSTQFQLSMGAPARFILVSESGSFLAWNSGTVASEFPVDPESVYKGLAIHGDVLYTTDFTECEVEAFAGNFFDGTFDEFPTAGGFEDGSIPAGFCPFGIQAIGNSIFVTYAPADGDEEVPGQGHGVVREFDADGHLVAKVASHGQLNAPWGLVLAPPNFGRFSGCLLVGNFGDGEINAYCKNPGGYHHSGTLRSGNQPLRIDGLWGIGFGNGAGSGPTNVLYFAAGPDDEVNGSFGKIQAVD